MDASCHCSPSCDRVPDAGALAHEPGRSARDRRDGLPPPPPGEERGGFALQIEPSALCGAKVHDLSEQLASLKTQLAGLLAQLKLAQAELDCQNEDGSPCVGPGQKPGSAGEIIHLQQQISALKQQIAPLDAQLKDAYDKCCKEHSGDFDDSRSMSGIDRVFIAIQGSYVNNGEVKPFSQNKAYDGAAVGDVRFKFSHCWHSTFKVDGLMIDKIPLKSGDLEVGSIMFENIQIGGTFDATTGEMVANVYADITVGVFLQGDEPDYLKFKMTTDGNKGGLFGAAIAADPAHPEASGVLLLEGEVETDPAGRLAENQVHFDVILLKITGITPTPLLMLT